MYPFSGGVLQAAVSVERFEVQERRRGHRKAYSFVTAPRHLPSVIILFLDEQRPYILSTSLQNHQQIL